MSVKRIMVLGGAGRVGMQIASELMRRGQDLVIVDIVPGQFLRQRVGRLLNDTRLAMGDCRSKVSVYGDVDALDKDAVRAVLVKEKPDLVINYAIPITWDATKRLGNYARISEAGLGAFTPIQVLTPLKVGQAIVESGIQTQYMVGNLPDITVPLITGLARKRSVHQPVSGAGNVGLNQVAMRRQISLERSVDFDDVELSLVSHHIHWVAPREPGYSNEAPFLARVVIKGADVTEELGDLRALMNRGVMNHYESDASFSSTTGILATQVALALLDESDCVHRLHAPAPNGLPGGYPVAIANGEMAVDLPDGWQLNDAITAMKACHRLDGVEAIDEDGAVHFTHKAQSISREELGFDLPGVMNPAEIEEVAQAQIAAVKAHFTG
ncbi:MAG: NAD-dependent epimerase/dehydratase family protein [Halioglobus sp.]